MVLPIKPCFFVGSSRKDLSAFPDDVKGSFGHALHEAQCGLEPQIAKALKGFGGRSTLELIEDHDGETYRAVYTVRFSNFVYVLHCFQKKSKTGIATPQHDLDLIRARLPRCGHAPQDPHRNRSLIMDDIAVEQGSSNVFADLGASEPDDMLLRSSLVIELRRIMRSRGLTQIAAAKMLGIGQTDLSKLLGGQLRRYTAERILHMLTALDQDIEIVLHARAGGGSGRITVRPSAA